MAETTGYLDVTAADAYFANRLNAGNWDNATAGNKSKSLIMARNMIDDFVTFSDVDTNEEITYDSSDAPDLLKYANAEQALYLLGVDPTAHLEVLGLGIKIAKGTEFDKSFTADMLCDSCLAKLKGINSDDVRVNISSGVGGGISMVEVIR